MEFTSKKLGNKIEKFFATKKAFVYKISTYRARARALVARNF